MLKHPVLIACSFFGSLAAQADTPDAFPKEIDYFNRDGIEAVFVGIRDPGLAKIRLLSGESIEGQHDDDDWEMLHTWEEADSKAATQRAVLVKYTLEHGISVEDRKSGESFTLRGPLPTHPIDLAVDQCREEFNDMIGIKSCLGLAIDAWAVESARAYINLGGDSDPLLMASQDAWSRYSEAQIDLLRSVLAGSEGSISGLYFAEAVAKIYRNRTEELQAISR